MKKNFFLIINILILIFVSPELKSQDTATMYFDDQWQQCDKEHSSYYRKYYKTDSNNYFARDYYNSGQLQMTGTYKTKEMKVKHGHFVFYYSNGQKKGEGNYIDDKREGKWTFWWENGHKRSEGEFFDGKRNGKWVFWHENGQKKSEGEYLNGTQNGKWIFRWENGVKEAEGDYVNGKQNGKWIFWTEDSLTGGEGMYSDGKRNGKWTTWWENGQKKSEGEYVDDKRNGKWIYWYKNGQKKSEGAYSGEKKNGKWKNWSEDGNTITEVEYKNDKIVSLVKIYDKNGHLLDEYVSDLDMLDNSVEFKASIYDYLDFLNKNIHYPEQAREYGFHGKVFIEFTIDETGKPRDIKVLRGVSDDIDKEAKRVVGMYQWPKPVYKGKGVKIKFRAPIQFTLESDEEKN